MDKSTREKIDSWKKRNKLNKTNTHFLLEAFRRVNYFHKGNVDEKMILLAFPSEIKKEKKFFTPYSTEQARCQAWFKLTEEGKRIVKDLDIIFDEKMNEELYLY